MGNIGKLEAGRGGTWNHSRPQRPRSFWSAPRIATSGLHSGQTTGHARDLSNSSPFGHFPVSSHKISTVNLRHSSHLGTKSNHSASTNVPLPSFTAQATGFFIWKSDSGEADMSLDLATGPQRSNECASLSRARARGNGLHHFP